MTRMKFSIKDSVSLPLIALLAANSIPLMGKPYARVVVLHVAMLVGGFLSMAMGEPAAILFVLVVLKTALDVNFHLRERRISRRN